jgi:hypothetical protein
MTPITVNLLPGQDVLTVASMRAKLEALLRGLGCGFVPEPLARAQLDAGRLVQKETARRRRWRGCTTPGAPSVARWAWGVRCNGGCTSWRARPRAGPCWSGTPACCREPVPGALCAFADRAFARRLAGRGAGQLAGRARTRRPGWCASKTSTGRAACLERLRRSCSSWPLAACSLMSRSAGRASAARPMPLRCKACCSAAWPTPVPARDRTSPKPVPQPAGHARALVNSSTPAPAAMA